MGDVLKRTLPVPAAEEQEFVNPYDALIAAQMERMGKIQRKPMYTPEQVTERRGQNQREYELGLLGVLSGNKVMGEAGGMVLKNALANRQPKVTERGVADPLSGEFTEDPEYTYQREATRLDALQKLKMSADIKADADRREKQFRREMLHERQQGQLLIKSLGGGGGSFGGPAPQLGVDPTTQQPVYRHTKSNRLFTYDDQGQPVPYAGKFVPKPSTSQATEDERKAAGWLQQAEKGWADIQKVLQESPDASQIPLWEKVVGGVPRVGEDAANALRSQHRQRFKQASKALSESMLRAATGAGYNMLEAKDAVEMLTPVYGEAPETTKQKMEGIPLFLKGLRARAGRAALPAVPGSVEPAAAAASDDPLGLRGGQ